jgi:hypothetical protein
MSERLKAHLESDLADAQVAVPQQGFGFLDPHLSQILHKRETGCLFESPTEVIPAYMESADDARQFDAIRIMAFNIVFRPSN